MNKTISLLLALSVIFSLCACGDKTPKAEPKTETPSQATTAAPTGEQSTETAPEAEIPSEEFTEEEPSSETEETKPTVGVYTVHVIGAENAPLAGVDVIFHKPDGDSVVTTDENGKAALQCLISDVTASLKNAPEGYAADRFIYGFDEVSLELTITLELL